MYTKEKLIANEHAEVKTESGLLIALCYDPETGRWADTETARDNANLFAAAPALVEALEEADRWLERDLAPDHPVMIQIMKALALAEGKEAGK